MPADSIAELKVKVGIDNADATRGLADTKKQVDDVGSSAGRAAGPASSFFKNIVGSGLEFAKAVPGIGMMASGIASLATGLVSGNAAFEGYSTQFAVLLKGTDSMSVGVARAKTRIADLTAFAANTPFELPQVVQAGKTLEAFGLQGDKAMARFKMSTTDMLTLIGDAASGSGADFNELSNTFGKFASGATGEALARLQELGIVTKEQLALKGIKFDSNGSLVSSVDETFGVMSGIIKGKMGGMMDAQSKTFDGMMSNLSDWLGSTQRALTAPLFDVLKTQLTGLLTFLGSDAVKGAIAGLGAFLAQGMSAAMSALGTVFSTLGSIIGTVGPPVAQFLGGVLKAGLDAVMPLINAALPVIRDFGAVIMGAFSSKSASADLLAKLPGWLQPIAHILGDVAGNWHEFFDALGSGTSPLQAMGDLLKNNITDALTTLGVKASDVSGFFDTLGAVWRSTQAVVSDLATALGSALEPVFTPIQQAVATLSDAFGMAGFAGVLAMVNGTITSSNPVLQGLTAAFGVLSSAANAIGTALAPVAAAVGMLVNAFGAAGLAGALDLVNGSVTTTNPVLQGLTGLIAAAQPVVAALGAVWGVLAAGFGTLAAQVMPALQAAWAGFAPALSSIMPAVQALLPLLEAVAAILGGALVLAIGVVGGALNGFVALLPGLGQMLGGLVQIISGVVQVISGVLTGLFNLLADLFTGRFDKLQGDFLAAWHTLEDGVKTIAQGLVDAITGLFRGLFDGIVALATGFWQTVTGIFTAIADTLVGHSIIPDMVDAIKGAITGMVTAVVGFFTDLKDKAIALVTKLASDALVFAIQLKDNIVNKATEMRDTALAIVGALKDKAVQLITDLASGALVAAIKFKDDLIAKATELKDGFISGITALKDGVGTLIQATWDNAVGVFGNALTTFSTAGGNIIQGLLNGLSAGKDSVISFITGIASGALDAIKQFFGIQSPSTEMHDVGEMLTAGLNNGLEAQQDTTVRAVLDLGQLLRDAWNTIFGPADLDGTLNNMLMRKDDRGFWFLLNHYTEVAAAVFTSNWQGWLAHLGDEIAISMATITDGLRTAASGAAQAMIDGFVSTLEGGAGAITTAMQAAFGGAGGPAGGTGGGGGAGGGSSAPAGSYSGPAYGGGGGGRIFAPGMGDVATPYAPAPGSSAYGGAGDTVVIGGVTVTDAPPGTVDFLTSMARRKNIRNRGPSLAF